MHPGIKLRHIRAFLDIAAEGSLTAVARAQGITQPALSRSLAELEALLGQPLFHRQGRRLVLTEAGALFRRHAGQGVQAFEAAWGALRPGTGGTLRLGVLPTAATRLVPLVALRFRTLNPDTVLSVISGPHAYLMRNLREGGIDLMVGRMPQAADMPDLSFDHLYEEQVVLCARAGHPLARMPVAEVLRRVPLVLPPEGAVIRPAVEDYMASLGLAGVGAAFETVSFAIGRGLVLGSDAVWFISKGVIGDDLARGDLMLIPTGDRFLSGSVGLTRRQAAAGGAGVDLLVELTRAAVAEGAHR
ncbi:LysR family transcriptional regulator [Fertoebacter nigrum]|uniref:LysR family transcriptional regulator n=1 Tax=Fertoeibacter niger TaxID=2656921 RepID=A0A8X8GXP1_9RHOB|nr:LysR substrate-binding domain-containing protein [Fertoeibacter niger]NUB46224.1 LysR family transcriptional regulator [Fertoeibacter niger]